MKITLESTTKLVTANGITCRVWEGTTAAGVKVSALIPRIAVAEGENTAEFESELEEHCAPSPEIQAWPLRMIL